MLYHREKIVAKLSLKTTANALKYRQINKNVRERGKRL